MAENVAFVEGDSPEAVAYALLCGIAQHEGKLAFGNPTTLNADADWILSNYERCLKVVKSRAASS